MIGDSRGESMSLLLPLMFFADGLDDDGVGDDELNDSLHEHEHHYYYFYYSCRSQRGYDGRMAADDELHYLLRFFRLLLMFLD